MAVEDSLSQIYSFFSNTFGLPSEWFQGVNVIFYFMIPLLTMATFWYYFLNNKIRLLRSSSANAGLGALITLMSTAAWNLIPGHPVTTVWTTVAGAILFEGSISLTRLVIAFIVAAGLAVGFPILMNYVMTQV